MPTVPPPVLLIRLGDGHCPEGTACPKGFAARKTPQAADVAISSFLYHSELRPGIQKISIVIAKVTGF